MSNKKAVLVGYSGHGFVVAEAAILSGLNVKYYTEIKELASNPFELKYLGFEMDDNFKEWESDKNYILGIGDNYIRHKVGNYILNKNKRILNVIHPSASITKMLSMGAGNYIARKASINPLVKIGNFCIVNTGAIIEHESVIQDAVHVAPGAVLAGNVHIGTNTFIGANAVIKQGIRIGENAVIGAGSVVLNDVADNQKVAGNPGRVIC